MYHTLKRNGKKYDVELLIVLFYSIDLSLKRRESISDNRKQCSGYVEVITHIKNTMKLEHLYYLLHLQFTQQ